MLELRGPVLLLTSLVVAAVAQAQAPQPCLVPVAAAENVPLRLRGLPAAAHTYVNGQAVVAREGRLLLAPGRHEIQVEDPKSGTAFRRWVQIVANRPSTLPVVMCQVRASGNLDFRQGRQGPPGPRGSQGPRGRSADPEKVPRDAEGLARLYGNALSSLLDDLDSQVEVLESQLERDVGKPVPSYYVSVEHPGFRPPGPSGPRGKPGPAGLSGDVLLLLSASGDSLWAQVSAELLVAALQDRLFRPSHGSPAGPAPGPNSREFRKRGRSASGLRSLRRRSMRPARAVAASWRRGMKETRRVTAAWPRCPGLPEHADRAAETARFHREPSRSGLTRLR